MAVPRTPSPGDDVDQDETGLTEVEREWLRKNYGGVFNFLRSYGLSIHEDEDREEGRAILRSMMSD